MGDRLYKAWLRRLQLFLAAPPRRDRARSGRNGPGEDEAAAVSAMSAARAG